MLPSDVARLVLVYLKDEGLMQSYKQFFRESPHLEELRNHPDIEPTVPHDKGLHMILNEYAKTASAIKDRLNCNYLIGSLWKMHSEVIAQLKFQYTGNIGLLTAPAKERKPVNQGIRSRRRLVELRKQQEIQRKLSAQLESITAMTKEPDSDAAPAVDSAPASMTPGLPISSNQILVMASPVNLQHAAMASPSVPVNGHTLPQRVPSTALPTTGVSSTPGIRTETPASVTMDTETSQEPQPSQETDTSLARPEFRTPVKHPSGASLDTPIGKSPKRKSAAPKRIPYTAAPGASPHSEAAPGHRLEEDLQDLPEVLECLINNIEFQEKLAQNINSALPADNRDNQPEPVGATDTADDLQRLPTTIEELLNHNISDDTVHEIVNKTSTDPAFESLFSLFSQNSQDSQLSGTGSTSNLHLSGSDVATGQSSLPATPKSNQSHCLQAGQVTPAAANQNAKGMVPSTSETSVGGAANTVIVTTTGQVNGVSNQVAVPVASPGTQLQLVNPQCATSTMPSVATSTIVSNQPAGTLIALPGNQNWSQGVNLQQQSAGATQNLPGGTIFMFGNGILLGNPVVQDHQSPLQGAATIGNSTFHGGGAGSKQSAASSSPGLCPVHGREVNRTQTGVGAVVSPKSPVAPKSPMVQKSPRAILPKPSTLNTDVRPSLGSLSDAQRSVVRATSDRPFQGVGSNGSGIQSSPTRSPRHGGNAKPIILSSIRRRLELPGHQNASPAQKSVAVHQSQTPRPTAVTPTPVSVVGATVSQTSSSGSAAQPEVCNTKQRKQILYKTTILSRPLDFGNSCELGPSANSNRQPTDPSKSVSREKGRQKQDAVQRKTLQRGPAVSTSAPVDQNATQKVQQLPSGNSSDVDIAAHMLVSLAGSPRSTRQTAKQTTPRTSPPKSPASDHVAELRKEIGLTPRNSRPQQLKATATSPKDKGKDQAQPAKSSSKRKSKTPRKQTDAVTETVVANVATDSHRKSRTPSKTPSKSPSKLIIKLKTAAETRKSPGKGLEESKGKKRPSKKSKSPAKSTGGPGKEEGTVGHSAGEESKKKGGRGQKRRMEEDNAKEETTKKPKTSKNTKKGRKSKGFPSNLDVDKFLSSLQYTE